MQEKEMVEKAQEKQVRERFIHQVFTEHFLQDRYSTRTRAIRGKTVNAHEELTF